MKKVLAFIIALLILMLTACGQGYQPQQDISADEALDIILGGEV